MHEAIALHLNPIRRESRPQLVPRQVLPLFKRTNDHVRCSCNELALQLEPSVPDGELCPDPWRSELKQPPDVGRRNEVPRRAEYMRAQNVAAQVGRFDGCSAAAAQPCS